MLRVESNLFGQTSMERGYTVALQYATALKNLAAKSFRLDF